MGENIVERVAIALRNEEWGEAGNWQDADESDREYWLKSARAAIAALREPSDAMIEAGERTGSSCCGSDLSGPEIERLIWTSMIDTALTEGTNHDQG